MANKSNFTPEEWKTLLEGAMMSGLAVTAAEPSGILGVLKESFAASRALIEGKSDSDELVKAIEAEFETSEGRTFAKDGFREKLGGAKAAELKAKCIDTLKQAAAILEAKAPARRRGGEKVVLPYQRESGRGRCRRRIPGLRGNPSHRC